MMCEKLVNVASSVAVIPLPRSCAERTDLFETRIVGVAAFAATVERRSVGGVELGAKREAPRQVWIGDEGASEGNEVCRSSRKRLLSGIGIKSSRHDERPGKQRAQQRRDRLRCRIISLIHE